MDNYNKYTDILNHIALPNNKLVLVNGLRTWNSMLVWEKENKPKEK